jgi:hypothetical protein
MHGLDPLTHLSPSIQLPASSSETSEKRKQSLKSPANSCQCFFVMDPPEIHQVAGPVVVGEFLTAIQTSDVASSPTDRSASGKAEWDGLAQRNRRTFMPMRTDKNKTKQCPEKERDPEDQIPPRLATAERPLWFDLASCCRAK